jgi:hypothetical protein
MRYEVSVPFRGSCDKALSLAESALTALGFRSTERTAESLEMVGPGMHGTQHSPLAGTSRIHVRGGPGELALEADLGGVVLMARFVTVFPPALWLFLATLFSVLFSVLFGPGLWLLIVWGIAGGLTLFWLLIAPMIARAMRARASCGLDALLANMVATGEAAEAGAAADPPRQ